ncbi:uncharacterized protein LOC141838292 [Curcuma longa]|uniref:uncharacterized protein LOC141838292 n=1 Tax=Curcuma longa TaxID=136217 RepID=UPI003D9F9FB9
MDEVVGEGASVLTEPHPPGEERTQLDAVDVGLTQFDQADRRGEADFSPVDKGSSSLSFPSGFDAGAPDLLEASEPLADASSACGDGTNGGRVEVIDVDDTENPQCEQATGCMTGLSVPQVSVAPLSSGGTEKAIACEVDSSNIAVVDADTLPEEGKADSNHILQCQQVKNDEQVGILTPQGPPDVTNCDFDGGNPNIPVSEDDIIISIHGAASAVSSDMEVSKLEVDAATISQHCKDGLQGEAMHCQGASAVFSFSSDGVKFSAFESDNGISAIGNVDVVEEAVLKTEVDSFPVSEWQQGKEEDSIKEEILVPQSSYSMSSSGFDGGLLNCDAFEIANVPTTAVGDNDVHLAALKVDVDTAPIVEGKQVPCEESDVLMHVSSISESAPEKVGSCEPVTVAMPGDDDAMKVDMAFTDIDKLDNRTLPICEQTVNVVVADISMSKVSSSEFPFDSDHGLQDISVLEPDMTTISHNSADAVDDEAMQMDADDTATILQRGGRRKRGRPSKTQFVRTSRQKAAEEVCFICFDGGDLVVCDRRGCPKVYHPSCVNRDEAFFRAKGRWTCGWHLCSICERTARYMCFSCTYSLCKGCIKESGFICLRENKGFCEACMSTVMLIETKEYGNGQMITVDFDDRSSFEYLFKDYYLALKAKLSLTLDELMSSRNPIKRSDVATLTNCSGNLRNPKEQQVAFSDSSSDHKERTSRRKISKKSKKFIDDRGSVKGDYVSTSVSRKSEWATDELLEFVAHMRNGDTSALSQFDVQALLLDYIKKHNLRDRRRKSQIVCDSRLGNLFGKERVGHFEMLKLLESHFLIKEVTALDSEDKQGGVVDPDSDPTNAKANNDPSTKLTLDKRRKAQKKVEDKELLNNLDDYAAIDVHNISLMYLRRNLMEDLIDDDEFEEKAIGSFVRIRISGLGQRQDMYRLVQVIGSGKATEQYKSGKGTTDVTLEILNLNKKEIITIDIISNQEFTEEECKRLRQSIKCGFIGRPTVGEVLEKAMSLQHVRVNDWLESEKSRLGHLRDRASEKGHRKELRECVEKLQLLNTPEEQDRRLNEAPDIHTDPHMDPDFESAEEEESDVGKHDFYDKLRESSFTRNGREVKSPGKGGSTENWSSFRKNSNIWESNRSTQIQVRPLADSFSGRRVDATDFSLNQSNDTHQLVSEAPKNLLTSASDGSLYNEKHLSMEQSEGPHGNHKASFPVGNVMKSNTSESEKIWHYKDPSARIQGPFSMSQLRKWSTTGYFPPNLMIWRTSDKPEDSITLTDAMAGKFEKDLPEWEPPSKNTENLVDVSPTPFSAEGKSEGVQRGSKENTQKVKPSSWSSTNMDAPSSTSPNDANISIGQGKNKPIESQPNSQYYVNSQFNRYSTSNQLSSTITKISLNDSYQLRNDSSDVPTPTSQPSSQGWSNAQGFANKHMAPNVSVHDMASGWVTPKGGMEEIVSLRNTTNSLTELGSATPQFVPDQAVVRDGGKYLPAASVQEPEMKRPQTQEGAASETSFSDHDQNHPGKHSLTTQGRSSNGIGPTNDPVACAQIVTSQKFETPDVSTPSADAARKLFVQTNASESILAQRSQASAAPNSERMNPTNFEIPIHMSITNNQMPSSNMPPYGWSFAPDSAAASNDNIQLLCSNGSNPPSSQFGSNASVVSVKPTQMGFVNGSNIQNTTFPAASQNPSTNPGSTQGTGSWTPVPQGNMNIGWGMVAQNNMNMPWGQTTQTLADFNMGLGVQNQVNPMVNPGWVAPAPANTNMNAGWVAPAMGNTNQTPGWGAQLQGNFPVNPVWAMFMPGQPNPSPGWVAPLQPNTCHTMETSAPAMNMNPAWGPGQGNIKPSMNPPVGNPQSFSSQPPQVNPPVGNPHSFSSQQPQAGDRRTDQGDNPRANDSRQPNPRSSWNRMQPGGSSAPQEETQAYAGIMKWGTARREHHVTISIHDFRKNLKHLYLVLFSLGLFLYAFKLYFVVHVKFR